MSNEQAARPLEFDHNPASIRPVWIRADQLHDAAEVRSWLRQRARLDANWLRRRGRYGKLQVNPITLEHRTIGYSSIKHDWYLLAQTAWGELMRDLFPHRVQCADHEMACARRWIGENVGGHCRWLVHEPGYTKAEFRFHAREDHALFMMVWR